MTSRFLWVLLLLVLLGGPATAQEVYGYSPAPGSQVGTTRPTVSALFGQGVRPDRILVDGTDFTAQAARTANSLAWTPGYDLDYGQHRVEVFGRGMFNSKVRGEWTFTIVRGGITPGTTTRAGLSPAPGSSVGTRPTIAATFTNPVQAASARLLLDGADYSAQAYRTNQQISWTPTFDLAPGSHQAQVVAIDQAGRAVQERWSFNVSTGSTGGPANPTLPPANSSVPVRVSSPKAGVPVGQSFFVQGRTSPGGGVHVEILDLGTGRIVGAFDGVGDAAGYFSIPARAPRGSWTLAAYAIDPAGRRQGLGMGIPIQVR